MSTKTGVASERCGRGGVHRHRVHACSSCMCSRCKWTIHDAVTNGQHDQSATLHPILSIIKRERESSSYAITPTCTCCTAHLQAVITCSSSRCSGPKWCDTETCFPIDLTYGSCKLFWTKLERPPSSPHLVVWVGGAGGHGHGGQVCADGQQTGPDARRPVL